MKAALWAEVGLLGWLAWVCPAGIIYVDDDAPPAGNGANWNTPFRFLADALVAAQAGDEIRVGQGVYRPDRDAAHPNGTGNRNSKFQLRGATALRGGFAGYGAADPNLRDSVAFPTVLSGDLLGNDEPGFLNYTDNSYSVVRAQGLASGAELDGVTITSGSSEGQHGAGLSAESSNLSVIDCTWEANLAEGNGAGAAFAGGQLSLLNCTFINNRSLWNAGGGLWIWDGANLSAADCTFTANSGNQGGALHAASGTCVLLSGCTFTGNTGEPSSGGAIKVYAANYLDARNCTFYYNDAPNNGGGGIDVSGSTVTLVDCLFERNHANYGAGIRAYNTTLRAYQCQFRGNRAAPTGHTAIDHNGGSLELVDCVVVGNWGVNNPAGVEATGCPLVLANCTIAYNRAQYGSGVGVFLNNVIANIRNTVLWGNQDDYQPANQSAQLYSYQSTLQIDYSCVQGWTGSFGGMGNVGLDPLFVSTPSPGPDSEWGTADDDYGDVRLAAGSPAIDAGSNIDPPRDWADLDADACLTEAVPVDADGLARFVDDPTTPDSGAGVAPLVDMGAYEFAANAFPPPGPCPADLNCDGAIDFEDIDPFVLAISDAVAYSVAFPACYLLSADANNDGSLDFDDINAFVAVLSGG